MSNLQYDKTVLSSNIRKFAPFQNTNLTPEHSTTCSVYFDIDLPVDSIRLANIYLTAICDKTDITPLYDVSRAETI